MIQQRRFFSLFLLSLLNLSVMTSLRNLPIVAEYGFRSLFMYLLVALIFLFPAALISAELATGWVKTGGVYIWVKEAFGSRWGFFAVWMQWIHNVTWFPAILSFAAASLAYFFDPKLAESRVYLLTFIVTGFWGLTFFNYFGLKSSSWFSALGVIGGTLIPGAFLIAFGADWLVQGYPIQIEFTKETFIPHFDSIQHLVFLTGLFLAFGGLEVSAVHAREVQNPQKNFPLAILISSGLAFGTYALGALAIAIVLPREEISLVSGLMEAFQLLLGSTALDFFVPVLAILIVLGAIGELNAWIIGPVRALHATSQHGDLPPFFQKLNRHGVPSRLLFFQGIIVTIAAFAFLWMPSASAAFWILSALSAQLYLLMYILMFLAAIKLRYSHPHVIRPYRIPYHMPGIWLIGGLGALSSSLAFLLAFVPPSQLPVGNLCFYEGFLAFGIALMCAIPLALFYLRSPAWHPPQSHPPTQHIPPNEGNS